MILLEAVIINGIPELHLPENNEGKKSMQTWE